jgi:hypothetical protein
MISTIKYLSICVIAIVIILIIIKFYSTERFQDQLISNIISRATDGQAGVKGITGDQGITGDEGEEGEQGNSIINLITSDDNKAAKELRYDYSIEGSTADSIVDGLVKKIREAIIEELKASPSEFTEFNEFIMDKVAEGINTTVEQQLLNLQKQAIAAGVVAQDKLDEKLAERNKQSLADLDSKIFAFTGNQQDLNKLNADAEGGRWYICDGKNETPNLKEHFILGEGEFTQQDVDKELESVRAFYTIAASENNQGTFSRIVGNIPTGESSVVLGEGNLPKHTHTFATPGGGLWYFGIHDYDTRTVYVSGIGPGWPPPLDDPFDVKGGNLDHNNMPPFYVLVFVMFKKD